jgi:hypothetical protein
MISLTIKSQTATCGSVNNSVSFRLSRVLPNDHATAETNRRVSRHSLSWSTYSVEATSSVSPLTFIFWIDSVIKVTSPSRHRPILPDGKSTDNVYSSNAAASAVAHVTIVPLELNPKCN